MTIGQKTHKDKRLEEIYLVAAMLVDSGKHRYSCLAIEEVNQYSEARRLHRYVMSNVDDDNWISSRLLEKECKTLAEAQRLRVLMLCMMMACCRDFEKEFFTNGKD